MCSYSAGLSAALLSSLPLVAVLAAASPVAVELVSPACAALPSLSCFFDGLNERLGLGLALLFLSWFGLLLRLLPLGDERERDLDLERDSEGLLDLRWDLMKKRSIHGSSSIRKDKKKTNLLLERESDLDRERDRERDLDLDRPLLLLPPLPLPLLGQCLAQCPSLPQRKQASLSTK